MDIGLDRLPHAPALLARLRGARVGVLAHAASVDRRLVHASEVLLALGVRPALLFAPEHGIAASAQDMAAVGDAVDVLTGAPIVSLYGESLARLSPTREELARIDVLVVDLADVGARYYTFVWTALLAARAAAAAGVHTVLLDRPNPIGGVLVEGHSQETGFCSFVGWERVPIRHGLTLAELVCSCARAGGVTLGRDEALSVLALRGWARELCAPGWDRPFVMPSPNMPTYDTALVYPGGCLIEGTNLSEGRGTTRPFELVGAPWLDGRALAGSLAALGLPGFVARPVMFQPTFHKHASQPCAGVQIHVTDAQAFRPVATYLALVALACAQDPQRFRFRTERYEYVDDIPAFDLLTGSPRAREAIARGADAADLAHQIARVENGWDERMREAAALVNTCDW